MNLVFLALLIFPLAIDAQSLSFVNLISMIIANGRFFQDNAFNPTSPYPSIDTGAAWNVNQSNCSRDFHQFSKGLASKELWALKTLDAWGKLPSGLLQGNLFWMGSVYECQHHLRGLNDSVIEQPFLTRTCTIGNGLSNKIRPVYGLCMPQSCNASDIVDFINRRTIRIPWVNHLANLSSESVHCIETRSPDTTAVLTILLLVIITFLILLATGLHMLYGRKSRRQIDPEPATASEPLLSRTSTTIARLVASDPTNPVDERDQSTIVDEERQLISTPRRAIDTAAQNLVHCCSLINNYQILKCESYPKNLACLNGIRVMSLCWVILGHTIIFAVYYSDNAVSIFNWSRKFWFQIIVQTIFSIDSFFVLSGLLTSFTYFMSKGENETFSLVRFILNHYVYHYVRYTPLYAVVLLVYITLSPYLGQGGPLYPADGIESASCRQTWWRNLIYINNFFDIRDGCMPVTWFLAVIMQFHWIAPLFLLVVSWKWLLGMLIAFAFILVDIISTAIIVIKNDYDHGLLSDFYSNRSNGSSMSHGYVNDVYIKPWCRLSPYAIGLAVGYILYEVYQRSNIVSWSSLTPRMAGHSRYSYFKQALLWAVALTILGLCVFGTYGDYSGHALSRQGRIAFLTLSRLGWAVGVSIIIAACFAGYGGLANRWLSRSFFYRLSKLTYGAYLWHTLIIFVNYLGREQPTHYTVANIIFNWICYTTLSYLCSFVTFLLIELPIVQLLKLSLKRSESNSN